MSDDGFEYPDDPYPTFRLVTHTFRFKLERFPVPNIVTDVIFVDENVIRRAILTP